jgi:peptidoglycan/xylan/chitin deacetylase (PgdA/CDA1 family)
MMGKIKNYLGWLCYYTGIFRLLRYLTRRYPVILVYHRFVGDCKDAGKMSAEIFEKQIKILKKKFNIITLSTLNSLVGNNNKLPPGSIVLTIDDGHADFYHFAYPLLKRYNVPATLFIATDFVDKDSWLWPDKLNFIIEQCSLNSKRIQYDVFDRKLKFDTVQSKKFSWEILSDCCISMRNDDCLKFLDFLAQELLVKVPMNHTEEFKSLNWDQIKEMKDNGIEIGSHTCSHPRLTEIDDRQLNLELNQSKVILEKELQIPVEGFCYPFGRNSDINDSIKYATKKAGYKYAVAGYFNACITTDPFAYKRLSAGNDLRDFIQKIYGFEWIKTVITNRPFDR